MYDKELHQQFCLEQMLLLVGWKKSQLSNVFCMGTGEKSTIALQDKSKTHDVHKKSPKMCKGNIHNARKSFVYP